MVDTRCLWTTKLWVDISRGVPESGVPLLIGMYSNAFSGAGSSHHMFQLSDRPTRKRWLLMTHGCRYCLYVCVHCTEKQDTVTPVEHQQGQRIEHTPVCCLLSRGPNPAIRHIGAACGSERRPTVHKIATDEHRHRCCSIVALPSSGHGY